MDREAAEMVPKPVLYRHDAYNGYPSKVYDYAEGYLRDCPSASLKVLQHDIRYYKGYLVPISTLRSWQSYMAQLGRIPRGRATNSQKIRG